MTVIVIARYIKIEETLIWEEAQNEDEYLAQTAIPMRERYNV